MITNFFSDLLQELGPLMKIQGLHPDEKHSCLIEFKNGLKLQMEPDSREEFLMIAVKLDHLPAGRYRENLFREALKANGMPLPRFGIFAYGKKSDCLILCDKLHIQDLTAQKVFDHLTPFIEKALVWKEALSRGDIPSIISSYSGASSGGGLFGMKP